MNIPAWEHLPPRYQMRQYKYDAEASLAAWPALFKLAYGREWLPLHTNTLRALLAYASGNDGGLPINKGLYIWGKVGTGKSMLLEPLRILTLHWWRDNWWRAYDCNTIALVRNEDAFAQYIQFDKPAYFDDLGSEPLAIKLYGSELYPMLEVITARYNLWQRKGVPTHFTSNHDLQWVDEHYGTRVASRLAEMCTVIEIKGKNLRIN
jgi:DNA replication protein DnaC